MAATQNNKEAIGGRAVVLFLNFFLIILAYYQVKSASRSLLLEYWGADRFAYVWIASALVLGLFISIYHRLVERTSRLKVVLGSCTLFIGLMLGFYTGLGIAPEISTIGFYIFVDIFSVILVEQFWSLTNSISRRHEGKRSYWFISSGGLVGGILGGATAAALLRYTPMTTSDLLLSCSAILGLILLFNIGMARMGLFAEAPAERRLGDPSGGWRVLAGNRYLMLIAAALLCAQLAQPLVEYQFIKTVGDHFPVLDERTQYLSAFFSVLGFVSLGINLILTPLIHRYLGVVVGMAIQPLMLMIFSTVFMAYPNLWVASAMKISDRGLFYSINRASKEQLYIPFDPVHTYQMKAWIDMLGYRLFKVLGSLLILIHTQWLSVPLGIGSLGWVTLTICSAWMLVLVALARGDRRASALPIPEKATA